MFSINNKELLLALVSDSNIICIINNKNNAAIENVLQDIRFSASTNHKYFANYTLGIHNIFNILKHAFNHHPLIKQIVIKLWIRVNEIIGEIYQLCSQMDTLNIKIHHLHENILIQHQILGYLQKQQDAGLMDESQALQEKLHLLSLENTLSKYSMELSLIIKKLHYYHLPQTFSLKQNSLSISENLKYHICNELSRWNFIDLFDPVAQMEYLRLHDKSIPIDASFSVNRKYSWANAHKTNATINVHLKLNELLKYFDNNDILNQYYLIEQNKAQHTIKTLLHQYFLYNDSLKLLYKHKNKLKTSLNDTTTRIMNGVDTTYSIFRIQKQLIDIEEQIQMNLKSQGETLLSLNKPYLVWYYTIQVLGNSTPQPQLNNNPKNITPYIPSHMNGNIL